MGGDTPPKLLKDGTYTQWKREIRIWEIGTSVEETKRASRIITKSLSGKVRDFASRMSLEELKRPDGVELLLKALDGYYKKDEAQTLFLAIEQLEDYRRGKEEPIQDYIEEFNRRVAHVNELLTGNDVCNHDSVLAYRLLKQASLTTEDQKIVRATVKSLTVADMTEALKKTLGDGVVNGSPREEFSQLNIKTEPVSSQYYNESEDQEGTETEFYNHSTSFRGSGKYRGRGNFYQNRARGNFSHYRGNQNFNNRQSNGRGRGAGFSGFKRKSDSNSQNSQSESKRASTNGIDHFTGQTKTCNVCKSIYHYARDCPDKEDKTFLLKDSNTIDDDYDLVLLVGDVRRRALIDSGAVTTVCGEHWINDYIENNASVSESKVDQRNFRFGDGPSIPSSRMVTFPIHMCGKDFSLSAYVVPGEIPLLMSRESLKDLNAAIDFKNDILKIEDKEQKLLVTNTGHYVADIEEIPKTEDVLLISNEETDPKKLAIKLHRYFGHASADRLKEVIANSNLDKSVIKELKNLDCEVCKRFKKERPKPKASLLIANDFNDIVGMDLKLLSTGHKMLHLIDLFSKFSGTALIENKRPETIIDRIFEIWVKIFGIPKEIFSDNGGEFVNNDLITLAEDLGIVIKTTAAHSPFSNGVVERHNGLIGETYSKIIEDVKCSPRVALSWSTNSKNSCSNNYGYSPCTLVFGRTPSLPGLDNIRQLTSLNESTISKYLADQLNAMYESRTAFIKARNSNILKRAIKDKVTFQDLKFFMGDLVYFKKHNMKRWCGPARVLGQDGKIVILRQGGFDLRVHASRVVLKSRADEQILGNTVVDKLSDQDKNLPNESSILLDPSNIISSEDSSDSETDSEDSMHHSFSGGLSVEHGNQEYDVSTVLNRTAETEQNSDVINHDIQVDQWTPVSNKPSRSVAARSFLDVKAGDKIRYKKNEDDDWTEAVIKDLAGKRTGHNKNNFNIRNSADQSECSVKLDKVIVEKASAQDNTESADVEMYIEDSLYLVSIPRERFEEPAICKAMEEELNRWKQYGTYREVHDNGQKTISTRWVVNSKGKDTYKARLVVRGFEETGDFGPSDSPTGDKACLRMIAALATSFNWKLQSIDIKSAYLQADNLDRQVYVRPPKELKKSGLIWQLEKPVYGLIDSARNWYASISQFLISVGCQVSLYDKALFSFHHNNKLCGLTLLHVDDFIFSGNQKFLDTVIKPLKKKYEISKHESQIFKYIGIEISQNLKGIIFDQKKYLQCIEPADIPISRQNHPDDALNKEEHTKYLSILGKVSWLAQILRPDLKFDVYLAATFNKSPTIQNLVDLNSLALKAKKYHRSVLFPKLATNTSWRIVVYSDASFGNLDGKVNSARGYMVLLCDGKYANFLTWNSNKVTRVVTSVLEAETLALRDGVRHAELLRSILCNLLFATECNTGVLQILAFTDSKQLWNAVHSNRKCKDVALYRDIRCLQEKITRGIITEIRWISNDEQLADCLTKKGASVKKIAALLESGELQL